ncbi:MAG: Gfo/Idh/MocA family oxidoreductase [Ruminococcaceae bacterium]|nr:Gfo/Idh/MocA family oxidoreductase [Oscillospiraceae bacterium]
MKTCIVIGAGGRGKDCYAPYIQSKGLFKITGVVEPDTQKREQFRDTYAIEEDMCFADYKEMFAKGRLADAVLICTQDRMHMEPTLLAKKCGYHILLEKPIAPTLREVKRLEKEFRNYDKVFMTGFVLRYTPFIRKIKEILAEGLIGDIVTMQLNENEGFWHHAHSYVRGPWSQSKTSSPLIVAKSSHDMDLMMYLVGASGKYISSYGDNTYFRFENAPGADVPARCTDGCPYADTCTYNAVEQYTNGKARYFVHKFECGEDREAIIEALKTNPYGRCVYRCDNDVCDHQVVSMEFENGVTAMFTVSAFSLENNRTLKLMGTKGEIGGCMETGEIVVKSFRDMSEVKYVVTHDGTKHCGGDGGLMDEFARAVYDESGATRVDPWMFEAHKIVFAAEEARERRERIKL